MLWQGSRLLRDEVKHAQFKILCFLGYHSHPSTSTSSVKDIQGVGSDPSNSDEGDVPYIDDGGDEIGGDGGDDWDIGEYD